MMIRYFDIFLQPLEIRVNSKVLQAHRVQGLGYLGEKVPNPDQ